MSAPTSNTSSGDALAALNSKTLGANMPVITLADGSKVQTGTVGALLMNIKAYDNLAASSTTPAAEKEAKMADLDTAFRTALPLIKKVGLLDLFEPAEWMQGSRSAGRKRVGELALEAQQTGQ